MDLSQLAQFLTPLLPSLLKGGVELSADSWEGLKNL